MTPAAQQLAAQALAHLEKACEYAALDLNEDVVLDAIALRLVAMIDQLSKLPDDIRLQIVGDEWHVMRGMRNRIVHGYATVNPTTVRMTVEAELPTLAFRIRSYIDSRG